MHLTKKLYGSQMVLAPDGTKLFSASNKRAIWYIKRNLATRLNDTTIQLIFEPKGKAHQNNDFYLEQRNNECVVCGNKEFLTKHHVVPLCFRKCMPDCIKSRDHHDIVMICETCHNKYETHAYALKQKLAVLYSDPLSKTVNDHEKIKIRRLAIAAAKHSATIPPERLANIMVQLTAYLGQSPTRDDLEALMELKTQSGGGVYGEKIVNAYKNNLQEFIVQWREHFVSTMKPKFLSKYWNVNKKIKEL